ncbi:hypothetical protein [Telluria beijingensis]|nr:hypothetical protein [Massilia sp. REN29]
MRFKHKTGAEIRKIAAAGAAPGKIIGIRKSTRLHQPISRI